MQKWLCVCVFLFPTVFPSQVYVQWIDGCSSLMAVTLSGVQRSSWQLASPSLSLPAWLYNTIWASQQSSRCEGLSASTCDLINSPVGRRSQWHPSVLVFLTEQLCKLAAPNTKLWALLIFNTQNIRVATMTGDMIYTFQWTHWKNVFRPQNVGLAEHPHYIRSLAEPNTLYTQKTLKLYTNMLLSDFVIFIGLNDLNDATQRDVLSGCDSQKLIHRCFSPFSL